MFRTDNLILLGQAKEMARELRKSQTRAEKIFWENVRNKRLKGLKFYRQIPIFYEINNHDHFFIADFFCFERKIIIEIDGKIRKYTFQKDLERTKILNSMGIKVLRFYNEEVENDMEKVLSTVLSELRIINNVR